MGEEMQPEGIEIRRSFGRDRITFIKVRRDECRNVRSGSRSFKELWGNGVQGVYGDKDEMRT
jgi:hypothetical protein